MPEQFTRLSSNSVLPELEGVAAVSHLGHPAERTADAVSQDPLRQTPKQDAESAAMKKNIDLP